MGWDVVQLGLKHDLPIDDPQTMAQVLARRIGCDVQVGYYKDCEYDEAEQRVYSIPSAFVALGTPHRGGKLCSQPEACHRELLGRGSEAEDSPL